MVLVFVSVTSCNVFKKAAKCHKIPISNPLPPKALSLAWRLPVGLVVGSPLRQLTFASLCPSPCPVMLGKLPRFISWLCGSIMIDTEPGYLSTPYTHEDHAAACLEAAQRGETLRACVQVISNQSACCASILDAWTASNGTDFWKVRAVQPMAFTGSVPVRSVRQCSGLDGRCVCAGEVTA